MAQGVGKHEGDTMGEALGMVETKGLVAMIEAVHEFNGIE